MSMSRKHYDAIATAISKALDDHAADHCRDVGRTIATNMAMVMKADNPRFDTDRWMAACGYPTTVPNVSGLDRIAITLND